MSPTPRPRTHSREIQRRAVVAISSRASPATALGCDGSPSQPALSAVPTPHHTVGDEGRGPPPAPTTTTTIPACPHHHLAPSLTSGGVQCRIVVDVGIAQRAAGHGVAAHADGGHRANLWGQGVGAGGGSGASGGIKSPRSCCSCSRSAAPLDRRAGGCDGTENHRAPANAPQGGPAHAAAAAAPPLLLHQPPPRLLLLLLSTPAGPHKPQPQGRPTSRLRQSLRSLGATALCHGDAPHTAARAQPSLLLLELHFPCQDGWCAAAPSSQPSLLLGGGRSTSAGRRGTTAAAATWRGAAISAAACASIPPQLRGSLQQPLLCSAATQC